MFREITVPGPCKVLVRLMMALLLATASASFVTASAQDKAPEGKANDKINDKADDKTTEKVPAAPAPGAAKSATDQACTLYFYRPRLARGSGVRIGLFVDGTMAVNLVNGRWASIQVPAGHHVIRPKDDQSGIEINSEPGQNYYFRASWGEEGFFHGAHKNVMIVMKEQASYEIKQLKPLDEKDLTWPGTKSPETKVAEAKH